VFTLTGGLAITGLAGGLAAAELRRPGSPGKEDSDAVELLQRTDPAGPPTMICGEDDDGEGATPSLWEGLAGVAAAAAAVAVAQGEDNDAASAVTVESLFPVELRVERRRQGGGVRAAASAAALALRPLPVSSSSLEIKEHGGSSCLPDLREVWLLRRCLLDFGVWGVLPTSS